MNSRIRSWWHKESSGGQNCRYSKVLETVPAKRTAMVQRFTSDDEMHALYRSIEYLLPEGSGMVIQFTGIKGGEGVSSVVRELAATAARLHQKRVLILDAAHHNPSQHVHFSVESSYGWMDAIREKEPALKACYPLDDKHPSLYLSPISSETSLAPWCDDETSSSAFFEELKENFDLVLIDSAPALASADSLTTCRFCDGVVLVLEAEKSWRLAETAKKKIAESGGSIVGVVFNKRTFYIPHFIYSRLY